MSKIDRKALVNRHNIVVKEPNNLTALTVGNGKFGYTVDVTGMQTFPMYYREEQSLCTLAEWGWHAYPMPEHLKGVEYQYRSTIPHSSAATEYFRAREWIRK